AFADCRAHANLLHSPHDHGAKLPSPGTTRADKGGLFAAESLLGRFPSHAHFLLGRFGQAEPSAAVFSLRLRAFARGISSRQDAKTPRPNGRFYDDITPTA